MPGNRSVRVQVGDWSADVPLEFQRLKQLCDREHDPYVLLAGHATRPSSTLGLNTARAVDVLSIVTGKPHDAFWQLAAEHKPIAVISAAVDVLVGFATAGQPATPVGDTEQGDAPAPKA
jgi:hypothetical protein